MSSKDYKKKKQKGVVNVWDVKIGCLATINTKNDT